MKRNILISTDLGWANESWSALESRGEVEVYRDIENYFTGLKKLILILAKSGRIHIGRFGKICEMYADDISKILKLNTYDDTALIVYHISKNIGLSPVFNMIRQKYHNVKTGYLFSNVMAKGFVSRADYYISKYIEDYDKVYAFDRNDVIRYNTDFSYLVYDPVMCINAETKYDVFLVAKAKDRLTEIMEAYRMCNDNGIIYDFYVNELSELDYERVKNENIHPNKVLDYSEVVRKITESKCILDIMQKGSTGVTLNICEAIIYNKKIISDNIELINEPFYDETMIYILGTRFDSIKNFIETPGNGFNKSNKELFSGKRLFDRLHNARN